MTSSTASSTDPWRTACWYALGRRWSSCGRRISPHDLDVVLARAEEPGVGDRHAVPHDAVRHRLVGLAAVRAAVHAVRSTGQDVAAAGIDGQGRDRLEAGAVPQREAAVDVDRL